jgi:hypothetical protein
MVLFRLRKNKEFSIPYNSEPHCVKKELHLKNPEINYVVQNNIFRPLVSI